MRLRKCHQIHYIINTGNSSILLVIPIFMIDLNWKSTIKKIELIEKSAKKDWFTHWSMIDLLFTVYQGFFIKLRSSLIDRIYILTMKKILE